MCLWASYEKKYEEKIFFCILKINADPDPAHRFFLLNSLFFPLLRHGKASNCITVHLVKDWNCCVSKSARPETREY